MLVGFFFSFLSWYHILLENIGFLVKLRSQENRPSLQPPQTSEEESSGRCLRDPYSLYQEFINYESRAKSQLGSYF